MKYLTTIFLLLIASISFSQEYEIDRTLDNGTKIINSATTNKYGLKDAHNNVIMKVEYDEIYEFNIDNYLKVTKNEKVGIANSNGKIVVPIEYDHLSDASLELIKAIKGTKVGFINLKNEVVIPFIYETDTINQGFGIIGREIKNTFYISGDGEKITSRIIEMGDFSKTNFTQDGLCVVIQNGKYGFINTKGKVVIPIIYEAADNFYGEFALVKKEGKFGIINRNQIIIIPFQYDDIVYSALGEFYVVKDSRGYYIDSKGKEINQ